MWGFLSSYLFYPLGLGTPYKERGKNIRQYNLAAAPRLSFFSQFSCHCWDIQKAKKTSSVIRALCKGGRIHHAGMVKGIFSPLCSSRKHSVPCRARKIELGSCDG